jgi:hypothetical protein
VLLGYHEGSGSLFKTNFKNSLTRKIIRKYKGYFYQGITLLNHTKNHVKIVVAGFQSIPYMPTNHERFISSSFFVKMQICSNHYVNH